MSQKFAILLSILILIMSMSFVGQNIAGKVVSEPIYEDALPIYTASAVSDCTVESAKASPIWFEDDASENFSKYPDAIDYFAGSSFNHDDIECRTKDEKMTDEQYDQYISDMNLLDFMTRDTSEPISSCNQGYTNSDTRSYKYLPLP